MTPLRLELAVQSAAGAAVARAAGADRVELCAALGATGGVTPSQGAIEAAVEAGLPVHVLVRCRPGPFVYDDDEVALMAREAVLSMTAGAQGVVVGALARDGALDQSAVTRLLGTLWEAFPEATVTFHRAMDVAVAAGRAGQAIDALVGLGVHRVLTSGGAARSVDGAPVLRRLVARARGRIEIMAGGGVRAEDVAALADAGVGAVHASARGISCLNGAVSGPGGGASDAVEVTSPDEAAALARAVAAVNAVRAA
ncbi:MAG: copper homeostasis protein CutC [Micrococcales bacterium]|nr:copper homeostasis protein CutC [Micrococcales bacterium]